MLLQWEGGGSHFSPLQKYNLNFHIESASSAATLEEEVEGRAEQKNQVSGTKVEEFLLFPFEMVVVEILDFMKRIVHVFSPKKNKRMFETLSTIDESLRKQKSPLLVQWHVSIRNSFLRV